MAEAYQRFPRLLRGEGWRQTRRAFTASASFAGLNETFLNARGSAAVLDAVKRCWTSLFGARTIYYRGRRGFSQAGMDIAVVVQVQIPSTGAGSCSPWTRPATWSPAGA